MNVSGAYKTDSNKDFKRRLIPYLKPDVSSSTSSQPTAVGGSLLNENLNSIETKNTKYKLLSKKIFEIKKIIK